MAEYINREAVLNFIEHNDKVCHYADERYENVVYATTQTICRVVAEMPAADVQPISQWISVKDRLPDEDGWYLVCKHNRVRVAEWCKDCWYNESDLPIDDCAITYWQPLPELPKDGNVK